MPRFSASPTCPRADTLPTTLHAAVSLLFTQGFPDPRGKEYRAVTIETGDVWSGRAARTETHGWVFPGGKSVLCWNGLVYTPLSVGGVASLRDDLQALDKRWSAYLSQPTPDPRFPPNLTGILDDATPEERSVSVEHPALLKIVFLLALGEQALAEAFWALWNRGMPANTNNNDQTRKDPYLSLASQWAWSTYDRAVCAHMRGADRLALDDITPLIARQPRLEAEASKRGYWKGGEKNQTYFPYLTNASALQADSQRRVAEPRRVPLDLKTLPTLPQPERIAALIAHFDELDARQDGQPGGVGLDDHPLSEALIREGDAAIDALLDVLERDTRLTRSVSFGRDFHTGRNLLRVKDAAFACFARITRLTQIGQEETRSLKELRAWWEKSRALTPPERWFAQLAEDGKAGSSQNVRRWEEAAQQILQPSDVERRGMWESLSQDLKAPLRGEPLRKKRAPSVAELLRKRALELSEMKQGRWGFDYVAGVRFALMLCEWEPQYPELLPTLQEVMHRCLSFHATLAQEKGGSDQFQLGMWLARLTTARLRRGDAKAADEYGGYLKSVSPRYLGAEIRATLATLWEVRDHPAIQRLSARLFTEPGAWSELLGTSSASASAYTSSLFDSLLLTNAAFRALVLRRLRDTTPAGTVTQEGAPYFQGRFQWNDGSQSSNSSRGERPLAGSQELRVCDRVGLALQRVQGVPKLDPFRSAPERDTACQAIAAFLKDYGETLRPLETYRTPLYSDDMGRGESTVTFPPLARPATPAEVAKKRAIFSLAGKQARTVPELGRLFPIQAQWKDDPTPEYGLTGGDGGPPKRVPFTDGHVWQAEEVWEGGKWVRYYGYVGRHSIAKVPASQVTLTDYRLSSNRPSGK